MTKESIFSLYIIIFTPFSCCRGVISVRKSHGKETEDWKEKKGKVKRKGGTRAWCFHAGYFSNIDYTIFDNLKWQRVQVSAVINKTLVIPGGLSNSEITPS